MTCKRSWAGEVQLSFFRQRPSNIKRSSLFVFCAMWRKWFTRKWWNAISLSTPIYTELQHVVNTIDQKALADVYVMIAPNRAFQSLVVKNFWNWSGWSESRSGVGVRSLVQPGANELPFHSFLTLQNFLKGKMFATYMNKKLHLRLLFFL